MKYQIDKRADPRAHVYLAGPTVFLPPIEMAAKFERMREICLEWGMVGVSPLEGDGDLTGMQPGDATNSAIYGSCVDLMHELDGGIFCFDSFRRGTEMDSGTAFELGYMKALGKPVAGWTSDVRTYRAKVRDAIGIVLDPWRFLHPQPAGTERDMDGVLVDSIGCYQNLMVQCGAEAGGGSVWARDNWEDAFSSAARSLSTRFSLARRP